jgi:hypothetical protein
MSETKEVEKHCACDVGICMECSQSNFKIVRY